MAVDEEICQNATGTPGDTIRPSLDARGSLFVHKDVAAYDELIALSVVRTAETVSQGATEARLKNDQRVLGGLDVAPPCGHTRRGLSHTHPADGPSALLPQSEEADEVECCKDIKEEDDFFVCFFFLFLTEEPQTGNAVGARSLGKNMDRSRARGSSSSSSSAIVLCLGKIEVLRDRLPARLSFGNNV